MKILTVFMYSSDIDMPTEATLIYPSYKTLSMHNFRSVYAS